MHRGQPLSYRPQANRRHRQTTAQASKVGSKITGGDLALLTRLLVLPSQFSPEQTQRTLLDQPLGELGRQAHCAIRRDRQAHQANAAIGLAHQVDLQRVYGQLGKDWLTRYQAPEGSKAKPGLQVTQSQERLVGLSQTNLLNREARGPPVQEGPPRASDLEFKRSVKPALGQRLLDQTLEGGSVVELLGQLGPDQVAQPRTRQRRQQQDHQQDSHHPLAPPPRQRGGQGRGFAGVLRWWHDQILAQPRALSAKPQDFYVRPQHHCPASPGLF